MPQLQFDDQSIANLTIDRVIENRAAAIGDGRCLVYGPTDRPLSYQESDEMANRFGNALVGLGVERQEKVSLMVSDPLPMLSSFSVSRRPVPSIRQSMTRSKGPRYHNR